MRAKVQNNVCTSIHIYSALLHESEYDMAKYFMSRLIYFQEPEASEKKPESEISCHILH